MFDSYQTGLERPLFPDRVLSEGIGNMSSPAMNVPGTLKMLELVGN